MIRAFALATLVSLVPSPATAQVQQPDQTLRTRDSANGAVGSLAVPIGQGRNSKDKPE